MSKVRQQKGMQCTLIFNEKNYSINFDPSEKQNLAKIIFLNNFIPPRPLCSGIGHCGRCRVKFHSSIPELCAEEKNLLSIEEQENGIRLACRHIPTNDLIVEISKNNSASRTNISIFHKKDLQESVSAKLLVDLGTTSIAWLAINKQTDKSENSQGGYLAEGSLLNPQMIAGSDIMARLSFAETKLSQGTGAQFLQKLILDFLKSTCKELAQAHIKVEQIYLAANPAMMALTLGTDFSGISKAPYVLHDKGNRTIKLAGLAPIWIPPQLGPFVGADACAGLAYLLDKERPFLLADMGTNGEFIFVERKPNTKGTVGTIDTIDKKDTMDIITVASVPLGPALEGIDMRCGGLVNANEDGAILNFQASIQGLEIKSMGEPTHISGAAYISLIHILLSLQVIDRTGHFQKPDSPISQRIYAMIRDVEGEKRLYVSDNLYLCAEDIENILKVKAAFSTALELLQVSKKNPDIYLAGALGQYISTSQLENLSFLPLGMAKKTISVGNTSLKGLYSLATKKGLKSTLKNTINQLNMLDFNTNDTFINMFIEHMQF